MSFLEARKIVGNYVGERSCASVARRANTTNEDNKYRTLVEKLIPLEAKFYQTPAQQQIGNGERSYVEVQTKIHVGSTTPTRLILKVQNLRQNNRFISHQSVQQKALKRDWKTCLPLRPEKLLSQAPISQAAKNTHEHQREQGKTRKYIQKALKNKVANKNQTVQCSGIDKNPTKKL